MKKFITITIISEKDILVDEDTDGFTHLFDTEEDAKSFLKAEEDDESLIVEINLKDK